MKKKKRKYKNIQHINYELKKDIKKLSPEEHDRIRRGGAVHMPES